MIIIKYNNGKEYNDKDIIYTSYGQIGGKKIIGEGTKN